MQKHRFSYLLAATMVAASCADSAQSNPTSSLPTATTLASSTTQADSATTSNPTTSIGETASSTCPTPGSTISTSILVEGVERTFVVEMPSAETLEMPVIMNFHGLGSNAAEQSDYTKLSATADPQGFIVVTGNGLGRPQHWAIEGFDHDNEPATLAFVDALIDELDANYCADTTRVYATGMSNGGLVASALGCLASDQFAAVAPVALTAWDDVLCGGAGPIPITSFHGTDDQVVKFDGSASLLVAEGRLGDVRENMQSWAEHNGCDTEPTEINRSSDVTEVRWNCPAGGETVLYVINGGGHNWPGSTRVVSLGYTTQEISATETIVNFFSRN